MWGGLLLVPTHAPLLKLPLVNTTWEDCSPPTFTLHKGFDYIKMRMATFSPCISDLQIFTDTVKSLWFCFFKIFVHISCHQITKRPRIHRESLSRASALGYWLLMRRLDVCFWFAFAELVHWFDIASRHILQGCLQHLRLRWALPPRHVRGCHSLYKEGDEGGHKQLQLQHGATPEEHA